MKPPRKKYGKSRKKRRIRGYVKWEILSVPSSSILASNDENASPLWIGGNAKCRHNQGPYRWYNEECPQCRP